MNSITASALASGHRTPRVPAVPVVDVVVPVYNEEHVLAASITRLCDYLDARFPFRWRVTIADNASTDGTSAIAQALAQAIDGVTAVHLEEKGRGRALRQVWSTSDADVVAYMDVDLSTDLDALLPLVAGLVSGHTDVAIGSRLARGAHVVRGPRREVISRAYNLLLHADAAHAVPRCAVRVQGSARRRRSRAPAVRRGRRVVLRHRAPRAGGARRLAHPGGTGRLGRRSGLARERLDAPHATT